MFILCIKKGGYYGKYFLKFIEVLSKPFVVTFHTIVPASVSKNETRKYVLQKIAKKAKVIIVGDLNIIKKAISLSVKSNSGLTEYLARQLHNTNLPNSGVGKSI